MSDPTKRMEEAEALAVDLGLDPPTYTDVVIIAAALLAAEARGLEWATGLHEDGCPAVCDDESDQVLDDYQQCCCDWPAIREQIMARLEQEAGE